jgi:hypothetical protein
MIERLGLPNVASASQRTINPRRKDHVNVIRHDYGDVKRYFDFVIVQAAAQRNVAG